MKNNLLWHRIKYILVIAIFIILAISIFIAYAIVPYNKNIPWEIITAIWLLLIVLLYRKTVSNIFPELNPSNLEFKLRLEDIAEDINNENEKIFISYLEKIIAQGINESRNKEDE
mgnify:CR=1 FL=1